MIDKSNNNKMGVIAILLGLFLTFDIFTIISNIYVAPILDGYGLPDTLIYVKTLIFLSIFIVFVLWNKQREPRIHNINLKILLILGITITSFYFMSLYLYKYMLISDTTEIIKTRILNGNPALYLDFSGQNFRTLSYVLTIFGGFNSEIILFAEAIVLLIAYYSLKDMSVVDEKKHIYDPFMFDTKLIPLVITWAILSFLSINVLSYRYNLLESLEIGFAVMGFFMIASSIAPVFSINKEKNNMCTRSQFIGLYKYVLIVSLVSIILYSGLIAINITLAVERQHTYRLYSSLITFVLSFIIFFRVKFVLSIENK